LFLPPERKFPYQKNISGACRNPFSPDHQDQALSDDDRTRCGKLKATWDEDLDESGKKLGRVHKDEAPSDPVQGGSDTDQAQRGKDQAKRDKDQAKNDKVLTQNRVSLQAIENT
jgi:hypothetical protein